MITLLDRSGRELKQALRGLRRSPAFTVTALLILTLGIGMATAMFTVFDRVLMRPLPVRDASQLVLPRTLDVNGTDVSLSQQEMRTVVASSHTMLAAAGIAHQGAFTTAVLDGDRALSLQAAWVTGNFFDVLGVRPALGRFFTPAEETSTGTPAVVVLSYDTWRRTFGGDSAVIGRQLGSPYLKQRSTIVGVAPAGLAFPARTEYWTPLVYPNLDLVVRLRATVTPEAARAEFLTIMRRVDSTRVAQQTQGAAIARADVHTFREAVFGDVRAELIVLSAAVALLLLIACVNVGNLALLRATSRHTEIAVRRSLGATTGNILRPLLWESAVLALLGGVLGFAFATVLVNLLARVAPSSLPRLDLLRISAMPFGVAAAVTLIALIVASLPATLATMRSGLGASIRLDARSGSGNVARRRIRQLLVASQVALALLLLVGAGLLIRSLDQLMRVPLGFLPSHLSILTLARPVSGDSAMEQFTALYDRVEPALRAVPGVTAITPIVTTPFYGPQVFTGRWAADGQSPTAAAANPLVPFEVGGADYFAAFGIPILRGRGILESDRAEAEPVVVVSHTVAERFWPGQNPVGKRLRLVGDTGARMWHRVVGEAGDIRYRTLRASTETIYVPWRQLFFQGVVAIRTTTPLAQVIPSVRRALHAVAPEATLARAETMDGLIDEQLALPSLATWLLSGFGVAALLLAAIGLYGVMASTVRERTREFGIRSALGATPSRLRTDVLRQAAVIACSGAAVGLVAALVLSRWLRSLLFEVSPADPWTLAGSSALLLAVALIAAYLPAWRVTRTDPAAALRGE